MMSKIFSKASGQHRFLASANMLFTHSLVFDVTIPSGDGGTFP
jgi:hypothetical protein